MDSNDIFSVKRFLMLFRQSLTINMKTIAISVAGFFGLVFILLIYLQLTTGLSGWDNKDSFRVFVFLFFAIGLIYVGMAFPSFRSKGKSIAFLMFPSSTLEKYLLEFITRIIAFVVLMPLLFWIAANIEGAFIHLW
ncbi:MAG TPA: hypothetical protein PKM69_04205, partial [Bacteroidales bacterium]|nr:hypothetical protein [Bacteroidales bacterium]